MGISPEDTFTYWFPGELSKPESERRGLVYRHGTIAERRVFAADRKKAMNVGVDDYFDKLLELAKRGLVGWVGFSRPFDGAIEELPITEGAVRELVDSLRFASTLAEAEKKSLSPPAPSQAASSAKPV